MRKRKTTQKATIRSRKMILPAVATITHFVPHTHTSIKKEKHSKRNFGSETVPYFRCSGIVEVIRSVKGLWVMINHTELTVLRMPESLHKTEICSASWGLRAWSSSLLSETKPICQLMCWWGVHVDAHSSCWRVDMLNVECWRPTATWRFTATGVDRLVRRC